MAHFGGKINAEGSLVIESMSFGNIKGCAGTCTITAEDKQHPNKLPFTGVLLQLDKPSNQPPHGADGHRILVPKDVAKQRLKTLIGMGLNYAPSLDSHAPRRKVGVITGAWIEGSELKIRGFVWKKDFPEAVADLRKPGMGLSMELADVYVRDKDEQVWHLTDFQFSGATALYKKSAAYYSTALAAASAALGVPLGGKMAKEKEKVGAASTGTVLANAIAAGIGPAIAASVADGLKGLTTAIEAQTTLLQGIAAGQAKTEAFLLEAGYTKGEEEDMDAKSEDDDEAEDEEAARDASAGAEEDEEMDAAKKKSGDDEGEDDDDDDDEEDLDAALADLGKKAVAETPGNFNKNAKNQGRKNSVTLNSAVDIKAAAQIGTLQAQVQGLTKLVRAREKKFKSRITSMKGRLDSMEAQVELAAERVDRKTVPSELRNIIEKSGNSVEDLFASGRKLTVGEVDNMLATSGVPLEPRTRMALKNMFLERNLMEQGEVTR